MINVADKIKSSGLRPTKQRIELAELLFASGEHFHFTAEDLAGLAQKRGEKIALATIYNTLHAFLEVGLIREIAIEGQTRFFDTYSAPHAHYFDETSGQIYDAPDNAVSLKMNLEPPQGKQISGYDIVIRLRDQQSH